MPLLATPPGQPLNASSAIANTTNLSNMANNLLNSSASMNATSALVYFNQMQQASSAINWLFTELQLGWKVGS